VGLQIEYSLIQRTVEREFVPMAQALDLAFCAWATLGGGVLTGKYSKSGDTVTATDSERAKIMDKRTSDRNLAIAAVVKSVAEARGATPAQVAINWVRKQPGVMVPIVGARTDSQLADCIGCLEFSLSEDELARLDEVSRVDLGFPHEFLGSDQIRTIFHGNTFAATDCHRPIV
jgi:aryl-alcohol dehydrogenase-like predicted oxidoreductase